MAVLHSAFAFHAAADLRAITARCSTAGDLDPALLQQQARNVAEHAGGAGKAILDALRFDPEWLDDSETPDDSWRVLIALAEFLQPVPSLSRNLRSGFAVLEATLPLSGWDAISIRDLLRGRPLGPLLASAGLPHDPLPSYAGWLEQARVALLQSRLAAVPEQLPDIPVEVRQRLSGVVAHAGQDLGVLYAQSLGDARAMLAACVERYADLFLILD